MRRIIKRFLILILGIILSAFYCESLIYYVVVGQCIWPEVKSQHPKNVVKAFILADLHMLGPFRGHWLDKWRRELQMHRAYQAIIYLHQPEVVFILGDLFDEGEWTSHAQFEEYVERFNRLFSVPDYTQMYVVAGNHDIGFHGRIRRGSSERFAAKLNSTSVQHIVIKNNHFVLLNSMALHGDRCELCTEARKQIENISDTLACSRDKRKCRKDMSRFPYSAPIVMQHFPLYRESDEVCALDENAPPPPEIYKKFRNKIDSLSQEATDYLVQAIKPRVVFGGHTHHGCLLEHDDEKLGIKFEEHSVPSFSWRNRLDPKYLLVTIAPDAYAVTRCGLPLESSIITIAVSSITLTIFITLRIRLIGR